MNLAIVLACERQSCGPAAMSPITGLLQRSANPISSSFRQAVSMQGPNLAALGLEQLKKTAGLSHLLIPKPELAKSSPKRL